MRPVCAVICEYNPFHLGHAYQLSEMKRRGDVIAVMSGSFTQRGDAALLSKYERARAAVLGGADLVLELPFPYSSSRAERFAAGGVDIVCALGCVDELCFGSETGDLAALEIAAENASSAEFRSALDARLAADHAIPWRTAFADVYAELFGGDAVWRGSNDILALSYMMRLRENASLVRPVALRRIGEAYNGGGMDGFRSASSIRRLLEQGNAEEALAAVPKATAEALRTALDAGHIAYTERLFPLFAALIRTGRTEVLDDVPDVTAELACRMMNAARQAQGMEAFLSLAVTKRYSESRVRRALLSALLDVKNTDVSGVNYTTVLAANARGRELLSVMRKTALIDIITKPADYALCGDAVKRAFSLASRADSIWELLCDAPRDGMAMMREKPRIL